LANPEWAICATGQGLEVTGMANLDPLNICNGIESFHPWGYYQKGRGGVNDLIPLC